MNTRDQSYSKSINYAEYQIRRIESLVEEIRRRPGMYFGDVHIKSFTHNLRAIVIDCFEKTKASTFSLLLRDELKVKMRFEGLSARIHNQMIAPAGIWELHHFFEVHCLNLVSEYMAYQAFDAQGVSLFCQKYQYGVMTEGVTDQLEYFAESIEIEFALDPTIWKIEELWDYFVILDEFRDLALVYKEKIFQVALENETYPSLNIFHFPQGMRQLLNASKIQSYNPSLLDGYLTLNHQVVNMELAFSVDEYYHKEPQFFAYVNHQRIRSFGIELKAVKLGMGNGLKKYLRETQLKHRKTNPLRIEKHLTAAISLHIDEPCYGGSMKYANLNNLEIIKPISGCLEANIYSKMKEDEELAQKIIERFCD